MNKWEFLSSEPGPGIIGITADEIPIMIKVSDQVEFVSMLVYLPEEFLVRIADAGPGVTAMIAREGDAIHATHQFALAREHDKAKKSVAAKGESGQRMEVHLPAHCSLAVYESGDVTIIGSELLYKTWFLDDDRVTFTRSDTN